MKIKRKLLIIIMIVLILSSGMLIYLTINYKTIDKDVKNKYPMLKNEEYKNYEIKNFFDEKKDKFIHEYGKPEFLRYTTTYKFFDLQLKKTKDYDKYLNKIKTKRYMIVVDLGEVYFIEGEKRGYLDMDKKQLENENKVFGPFYDEIKY